MKVKRLLAAAMAAAMLLTSVNSVSASEYGSSNCAGNDITISDVQDENAVHSSNDLEDCGNSGGGIFRFFSGN